MLKIFNTLSRQKEEFKPIHAGKIGMYVCGITIKSQSNVLFLLPALCKARVSLLPLRSRADEPSLFVI
ncbi:hypothetical protein EWM60_02225 [Candidatus Erwinia dacicola]|nr:hypothetical protein [Candidatus Erwinia dacicola]NJD84874.1 hypothetical protein [Candidatus Erwinia dacicola]